MKLSKRSIFYRAARSLGGLGALLIFSGSGSINSLNFLAALIAAVTLITSYLFLLGWEYLVWKNYDYFLEEDKIRIAQGVFRKNEREIPLRRIQNVDISRNIVHRIFDLAKVELETAGGGSTEASLRYTTPGEATEIRNHVNNLRKQQEGTITEKEDEKPVYSLNDRYLTIYSATTLDTTTLFGILTLLGFLLTGAGAAVENFGLEASIFLTGVLVIGMIGSFALNFARNFENYYSFKLWRDDDALRYERGLLNRKEGTIPLEKIQDLKLEENFLKRIFNFTTLKIETAGYSGEKAMKKGSEAAIPLDSREMVLEFAEELEGFNMPDIEPVSINARRIYFGRYSITVGALLGAGYLSQLLNPSSLVVFSGVLFSLAGIASHLKYKNRGYALSSSHLLTVNGFWNRKTMIVPYYRLQNLIKTRTVFQDRFNLSTINVDIAGVESFSGNPVIHDLDREKAGKVEEEIYNRFRKSLKEDHSSM